MSRIGKKPVPLPAGVTASVAGQTVEVKGPKGTRSFTATDDVTIAIEGETVKVTPRGTSKRARQQWGMTRTQVANLVTGVTSGFKKEMEITGVGYRAAVQGKNLQLQLGFSHDVIFPIPTGIDIKAEKPTSLTISGVDKQLVGATAAKIRGYRGPEPYKGKGVRYADETIRRKEGKKK